MATTLPTSDPGEEARRLHALRTARTTQRRGQPAESKRPAWLQALQQGNMGQPGMNPTFALPNLNEEQNEEQQPRATQIPGRIPSRRSQSRATPRVSLVNPNQESGRGQEEPTEQPQPSGETSNTADTSPQGTASRLNQLKASAKDKFKKKMMGEMFRTAAAGNALVPGSRPFLWNQYWQLLALSPFAYIYVHVHFFCNFYNLNPIITFEEMDFFQKMLFYMILALETFLFFSALFLIFSNLYIAYTVVHEPIRVLGFMASTVYTFIKTAIAGLF